MDSTDSSPPETGPPMVFDEAEALDRAGSESMLQELVQLFRGEGARILHELRDAAATGNPEVLQRLAHTLKGSAGAVSGHAVARAARDLEVIAGRSSAVETDQALDALELEFHRLLAAFAEAAALKPLAAGGHSIPDVGVAGNGESP